MMALRRFLAPERRVLKPICMLKSVDGSAKDVELTEVKTEIGRSELTGITDTFCSKAQVIVKADLQNKAVTIKPCGVNPSGLNGFMMHKNKGYEGVHGDILEVLYGRYPYKINFITDEPQPLKHQISPQQEEVVCKKVKLTPSDNDDVWEVIDSGKLVICNFKNPKSSDLIASYDLDGTIITTKSGKTFPTDIDDWKLLSSEVSGKIKSMQANGFKIVIFTNQLYIGLGKLKLDDFKQKLLAILTKLNVPCQAFISTGHGMYRKPLVGMWKYLKDKENTSATIDMNKSFYVGDAAGREAQSGVSKRKKDHSCADRLFAYNIGLPFFTPEEHFQNKTPLPFKIPTFDPRKPINLPMLEPVTTNVPSTNPELVIMVGLPGSGKSHFASNKMTSFGYTVVNRDTLGSIAKCAKICEESLRNSKSCVVDNTNVSKESRKEFLSIAKKFGVPCRCFIMTTTADQTKHNLKFRDLVDSTHIKVNQMVFNSLNKKFEQPTLSEGFSEIVKVNCIPEFNNKDEENLYRMFLVEK